MDEVKAPTAPTEPIVVQEHGPVLLVTFHYMATDQQYQAHLDAMDEITERNRLRFGRQLVIIDATRWLRSNANQRKMHAAWMKKHEELMAERTAGVAFVIDSAFVRGGLTAVLWLAPMPCPHTVVKTLGEAWDWGERQLGTPLARPS